MDIKDFPSLSRVIKYFLEMSKIPHESGNRGPITRYLTDFAKERGLEYSVDAESNVVIRKPATAGYETAPTVVIQAHTDMVLATDDTCTHDPKTGGLLVYRDGDFLRARGTTLGGDDGIGVAYALAILDGDAEAHPTVEALFTSDEEVGLLGAAGLSADMVSGRILMNIDSDEEGVFTVGCAGGVRYDIRLPVKYSDAVGREYTVRLDGLLGGHSGVEIHKGRENAIKVIGEFAERVIADTDAKISDIFGGCAENAIPSFAGISLVSDKDIRPVIDGIISSLTAKYRAKEEGIEFTVSERDFKGPVITSSDILSLIGEMKCGVLAMSEDVPGLPETSQNLGVVTSEDGAIVISSSVRSAKDTEKHKAVASLQSLAEKYGAVTNSYGEYPGWEYKKESPLRDLMCKVYTEEYGKSPEVVIIHAGLECGILSEKLPGLDSVSFGPNNYDIHTPSERLSLSSSARVYEFIKKLLSSMKEI